MAEQTFRSPGFFEKEVDLSARVGSPVGIPAGIIGTSELGPAFVPVTVGTLVDFETRFGTLDPDKFGPYAVREFLKNKTAVTYVRVLGAGSNTTTSHIETTRKQGTVQNAGFRLENNGPSKTPSAHLFRDGAVQFLCATHIKNHDEPIGHPTFSDNRSFGGRTGDNSLNLVRAVLFTSTGSRFEVMSFNEKYADHISTPAAHSTLATAGDIGLGGNPTRNHFKLVLSSSGATFGNSEQYEGVRIYTASFDPNDKQYIGKILNTDPQKFGEQNHLLYQDFAVEAEIAEVSTATNSIALLSGSDNKTVSGGDTATKFLDLFGRYDTRYTTPRTTKFISQPFGEREYDLFHFETISDGAATNNKFKISIANVRKSSDPNDKFGTFEVQVRSFGDTDLDTEILERYPECSLNPNSDRYIARLIGDKKVSFNFDADDEDERRLQVSGKYPNLSSRIRVRMEKLVDDGLVPDEVLPFGFRGIPINKTSDTLSDTGSTPLADNNAVAIGGPAARRLSMSGSVVPQALTGITGSIVPPLPFRFKVTRGNIEDQVSGFLGKAGDTERVDSRFYFGVKMERTPVTSSAPSGDLANSARNSNTSNQPNRLIKAYSAFAGIEKLDTLVTGSARDFFNDNKFSLARVALGNELASNHITNITGSGKEHMLHACYVRNGAPDKSNYTVTDPNTGGSRITMATLVHSSAVVFNRFTDFNKFTNIFYGGFDGLNILNKDTANMTDKSTSSDTGGLAGSDTPDIGLKSNAAGSGKDNNSVHSFRIATTLLTDPVASNINILAIPGMRDKFITDFALDKVKDYSMAIYLMDLVNVGVDGTGSTHRLYDDSSMRPDVRETAEEFDSRAIDNSYAASYFPDVFINDPVNNRDVKVPASVAALSALGFNDRVSYPWFAPAGFNRGALGFVRNTKVRLTSEDRNTLYDARINPIANFPDGGFVIFGQKNLQMAKSALDRVNVRRLLLEVKRLVVGVANRLLFEQNTAATRARFVSQVTPLLALVQSQAGIESFNVVCDDTNNSQEDVESNKLNGRIVVVPTRAVEFIAIDFIITNSGVSFE